jgi:hypothetical protein
MTNEKSRSPGDVPDSMEDPGMHFNSAIRIARATALCTAVVAASYGFVFAQEIPEPTNPQDADRWVIEFDGGAFALLSRSATTKVLPGSDELPAVQVPPSGFWYELRSADGSVRYRRITGNPVRLVFEGPALDDGQTPEITEAGDASGAIAPTRRRRDRVAGSLREDRETRTRITGRRVDRAAVSLDTTSAKTPRRTAAPTESIATPIRDEAIPAQRVFALVTPAASDGDSLVLFSSPLAPNAQAEPATEIARFTVQSQIPQ